jgi:hypothetical protein
MAADGELTQVMCGEDAVVGFGDATHESVEGIHDT